MTSAEIAKKENHLPKNSLGRKNQNLEEKELVKELNKNSNKNPTKELKDTPRGNLKMKTKTNGKRKQEKITRGGDLRTGNQQAS